MGDKLKAGTLDDFTGSLAELIEHRFDALLQADGLPGLPSGPADQVRDRRRLFVAIAQGVVGHLAANPDAFKASFTVPGVGTVSGGLTEIDTV
jgi:hypothetical protein